MLIAGLEGAGAGIGGGDAAAVPANSIDEIAVPAISAATRREVLRVDISSTFREDSRYAAAAVAEHTLGPDPAIRKAVLTVFSAPSHRRLIREISLRLRPRSALGASSLGVMGLMGRILIALCVLAGIGAGASIAAADVKTGTSGPDRIVGTAGADRLVGKGGRDVLIGKGGRDILIGDAGGDRLYGGRGKDTLLGGSSNDRLVGGPGKDVISCGSGVDTVIRGPGDRVASDCERVRSA
jgi:hypothetical protein